MAFSYTHEIQLDGYAPDSRILLPGKPVVVRSVGNEDPSTLIVVANIDPDNVLVGIRSTKARVTLHQP